MERLQQALEKARSARQGDETQSRHGSPVDRKPSARRTAAPDATWGEVRQITPSPASLVHNRIVSWDAGHTATHFDILRTKILLQMRRNGWRRLAITSPTPACGKTTVALNLAVGLTRQPDMAAMLLELDLRRPNLATVLDHRPTHDITSMLSGEVPFVEQAVRLRGNVAVSMARRPSNDPTRYMLSHDTIETINRIEGEYAPDLMIFDLPPLLVTDDTRAFLGNVDCALMVARAGRSSITQIDTSEREIAEHTNMLGVVLNQCRFADEETGYDYSYETEPS